MRFSARYCSAWLFSNFLFVVGAVRAARKRAFLGDYILSIYFHKPSKKEFESCVRWLSKNKFTFLDIKEVDLIVKEGRQIPRGAVLLTVDDGWLSNENLVEIANQYEIPITIFITTEPVKCGTFWWSYIHHRKSQAVYEPILRLLKKIPNYQRLEIVRELKKDISLGREALTIQQLKSICQSKFVTIGSHTLTHPILPNCDDDTCLSELSDSKNELQSWIQKEVLYFAYPNGDYSSREIELLSRLNYRLAFTTNPVYCSLKSLQFPYQLPRFEVIENSPFAERVCRMLGIWQPLINRIANCSVFKKQRKRE